MLTKLIVASYVWLLEFALWLLLSLSVVMGYRFMVPIMNDAGAVLTNEFAWKIGGALIFPIITFLVLAVIFGPFLVLVDVRSAVRKIEIRLEKEMDIRNALPIERREPHF
ncbi:MAG: hypothetical protein ACKVP2_02750 [Burkholderiales bacterium]